MLIDKIENGDLLLLHLNIKKEKIFVYDNSTTFYTIQCIQDSFGSFHKDTGSNRSDMPEVEKFTIQTPIVKNFINGTDLKMNYVYTENTKFRLVSGKIVYTFQPRN